MPEEEPDLFSYRYQRLMTQADILTQRFCVYHRNNPGIYVMFKRFAFEAIQSGLDHYSAAGIIERIRWEVAIQTVDENFKISNDHRALYARLFHLDEPQHSEFFHLRKRRSVECPASGQQYKPNLEEPGEEDVQLNQTLRELLR